MARDSGTQVYGKVALIGLGLIASSMFWAIRRGGLAGEVRGYARSAATRQTAREIGLCDVVCDDLRETVAEADLVVLCVPVGVMGDVAAKGAALTEAALRAKMAALLIEAKAQVMAEAG